MSIHLRDDAGELLNVVRKDGSYFTTDTGDVLTVPRGVAHTYGIWHQTANILMISPRSTRGEIWVFLQKRSDKKRLFPGAWTMSCGGHMGTSIDPRKSAVREAAEELGLNIDPASLIPLHTTSAEFPNRLKVWRYDRRTILQMGDTGEAFGPDLRDVNPEAVQYVNKTGLDDFPSTDVPVGLELEAFNREFCFYYLYFPVSGQIAPEFRDREATDLNEIRLKDFLAGARDERTDSTETLILHCPTLEERIRDYLQA